MDNRSREQQQRDTIFNLTISEAGGFYKLVITVSSSFLGGSFLFFDKFTLEHPTKLSICFLFVGWVFLLLSMVLIILVRKKNVDSGRFALKGDKVRVKNINKCNIKLTNASVCLLVLGIAFLFLFGMINICNKYF